MRLVGAGLFSLDERRCVFEEWTRPFFKIPSWGIVVLVRKVRPTFPSEGRALLFPVTLLCSENLLRRRLFPFPRRSSAGSRFSSRH